MMSYTNSTLREARECLRKYDLGVNQQLELAGAGEQKSEALAVGDVWHRAFEVDEKEAWGEIDRLAPSPLWAEKIRRLFVAHAWYWSTQPKLEVVASEQAFSIPVGDPEAGGFLLRGKTDDLVRDELGRLGIVERKTTSEDLGADSLYWNKLRLDPQVGIYGLSLPERPAFILYDVVRKPTISPKGLTKAMVKMLRGDLERHGAGNYCGEIFTPADLEGPLAEKRESIKLYGARLTQDIGERPDRYFARRIVARTEADFRALMDDVRDQVSNIERAEENGSMSRNPDACARYNLCPFFRLCENNLYPQDGSIPEGYVRREARHPELDQ